MSDQPPQQPGDQPTPGSVPPYGPPAYGPPAYGPPAYGPPAYGPPAGYGHSGPPPDYDQRGPQPMFGGSPTAYPQQDLLPQEVKPGRSRRPLVIGLVIALLVVASGVGAWLVLRDNGESTRAQYCAALKKLVPGSDLAGAVIGSQASTLQQVKKVSDEAPGAVDQDWKTLNGLLATSAGSSSTPSLTDLVTALGALKHIVQDANGNCGMSLKLPTGF